MFNRISLLSLVSVLCILFSCTKAFGQHVEQVPIKVSPQLAEDYSEIDFNRVSGNDETYSTSSDASLYQPEPKLDINACDSFQLAAYGIGLAAAGALVKYREQWGSIISFAELNDLNYWDSTLVVEAKSRFSIDAHQPINWNNFKGKAENWHRVKSASSSYSSSLRTKIQWQYGTEACMTVSRNGSVANTWQAAGYARTKVVPHWDLLAGSYRIGAGCGLLQSGVIYTNKAMNPYSGFLSRKAAIVPYSGFTSAFARQGLAAQYSKDEHSVLLFTDLNSQDLGFNYEYSNGNNMGGIQCAIKNQTVYSGSLYGRQKIDKFLLNAEVGFTNKGIGACAYLIIPQSYSTTYSSGIRYYDSAYSVTGLPYSQGSKANNEIGWMTTVNSTLPRKINSSISIDIYSRVRGQLTRGVEIAYYLLKAKAFNLAIKYRKPISTSALSIQEGLNARASIQVFNSGFWQGKALVSSFVNKAALSGAVAYELSYQYKEAFIGGRMTLFYADSYNTRVYLQEAEVNNFYRFRAFNGKGSSTYIFIEGALSPKLKIETKLGYISSENVDSFEGSLFLRYYLN